GRQGCDPQGRPPSPPILGGAGGTKARGRASYPAGSPQNWGAGGPVPRIPLCYGPDYLNVAREDAANRGPFLRAGEWARAGNRLLRSAAELPRATLHRSEEEWPCQTCAFHSTTVSGSSIALPIAPSRRVSSSEPSSLLSRPAPPFGPIGPTR